VMNQGDTARNYSIQLDAKTAQHAALPHSIQTIVIN